ncbi:DNA-3-methyladenine glycosylase [Cellulomonas sp. PhB143]|uniref:DNA-3-methyladenine glycosylase family protein n=1 Tax=Cellulomonas sp. PhB143 TaxID=2485186 RepID=UPI000F466D48|nr:DNA-3-methyladenine glycosylase 2 family protein [Cellulomonas sp. PhB143]ROS73598.1 DNA-3-methyladenine glycosylase II [Cellulomonas sp. PhB143]
MRELTRTLEVRGPWSLATSRRFWEGFTPAALPGSGAPEDSLRATFRVDADWSAASALVTQVGTTAQVTVRGDGDLDAATGQVACFLALDVDATGWPAVGDRDPVIADAQAALPDFRPCGFYSPYEAAAWSVLSQRTRIVQAAALSRDLVARHGEDGAFPAPAVLAGLDLDLPGRKTEYLHAVARAALEGRLDGRALRAAAPEEAMRSVQDVTGIGPFAAELIVLRGANAPDALPARERRLEAEIAERYGRGAVLAEVSEAWRPFRTWGAVLLRALREERLHEIDPRPGRG